MFSVVRDFPFVNKIVFYLEQDALKDLIVQNYLGLCGAFA